jgi:hypothetical protein
MTPHIAELVPGRSPEDANQIVRRAIVLQELTNGSAAVLAGICKNYLLDLMSGRTKSEAGRRKVEVRLVRGPAWSTQAEWDATQRVARLPNADPILTARKTLIKLACKMGALGPDPDPIVRGRKINIVRALATLPAERFRAVNPNAVESDWDSFSSTPVAGFVDARIQRELDRVMRKPLAEFAKLREILVPFAAKHRKEIDAFKLEFRQRQAAEAAAAAGNADNAPQPTE